MAANLFAQYQVDFERQSFQFLYPADWSVRVIEDGGTEVFLRGPQRGEQEMAVTMIVFGASGEDVTCGEKVDDLERRFQGMPGYHLIGRRQGVIGDRPACEAEFTYTAPLAIYVLPFEQTTVRERHIFLEAADGGAGLLLELVLAGPEAAYVEWLPAFQVLVETLQRQPDARAEYYPLVAPLELAVREARPPYSAEDGTPGDAP